MGAVRGDVLGDNMVLGVSATKPRDSFPPVFWATIFWATHSRKFFFNSAARLGPGYTCKSIKN